jgi:hypothetical protein
MTALKQSTNFEFRSKDEINGWPLIHINFGTHPETGRPLVAKGVVAIGRIAVGIVSIGAVAFGVVTLAGVGLGIVSISGIAAGIVALGAIALGYEHALGALVHSPTLANGVINLDAASVMGSFIFGVSIALFIWTIGKIRAARIQN